MSRSRHALSAAVGRRGDVVLKDLRLKAEALNSLKLPVIVKAGFLGSVTLKVPWNRLGKESVVVLLDRIFILAEPIQDERTSKDGEKEKLLEAKRRRLKEAESALLDAKEKKSKGENTAEASSWLGSLIATIIGNLKISITNVHIRYEDCTSNPGKPFCCGVTLSKLAAVTIDENVKETFVTSGALDKLHKSIQLERFAMYHDSNSTPWKFVKSWSEMTPKEWCEIFEAGINPKQPQDSSLLSSVAESTYLLCPINGVLNYYRRGKREKRERHMPLQSLSLVLDDVSLTLSEDQYCDGLKLLEGVSRYRKRIEFSHFRPWVSVHEDPRTWWVYASQAELTQQKKIWSHFSWKKVGRMCSLRRKYVNLYLETIQAKPKVDNVQLKEIEEEVDTEVLLLWRLLARAKAESLKSKEVSPQQDQTKSGWWGFRWRSAAADKAASLPEADTPKQERELGDFTKEEWAKINEFLNSRTGEEVSTLAAQEAPDSLQILVDATIKESAVRILDKEKVEILHGNFTVLSLVLNLYPNTVDCSVKLQSYGLSAPEGSLIKSVIVKGNEQALKACYVHNPLDSPLNWKVSATVLPCYVTVWFASFERCMQFLKSGNAISPDVASETATVLQNKLEQVRRRAQEQFKMALKEESRFSINLDLDAPKVRIPASSKLDKELRTQLVLDLGHFTLHTDNEEKGNKRGGGEQTSRSLYSQCYISGNDIAAYLVDGPFQWEIIQEFLSKEDHGASPSHDTTYPLAIIPVIDRCRMFVLFEKLRIPHPAYPLTHIALQVPHLGLHFSSGRYQSLLQLLESFNVSSELNDKMDSSDTTETRVSWYPADCEGSMMVLVWKGIGNSVAEWQPSWSVLSGSYLYILESVNAQTYQRCCSITEKQILDVPSSSIGGSDHVLAVCNRGMELKKGLESSSSVIIKLADQESKQMWQKALMSAVFRLSTPVSLLLPEELDGVEDIDVRPSDFLDQPVLFVSGALHKLQLSIYAKVDENLGTVKRESLLLSLEAGGGEVRVLQRQYDLNVGTNLHYLKIKDRLKDPAGTASQYIARSLINRSTSSAQSEIKASDEDVFNDAMAEFGGSSTTLSEDRMTNTHDEQGETEREAGSISRDNFEALGLEHLKLVSGESLLNKLFLNKYEETRSFVSMVLVTRQFESPDYDGTDVKMSISMATLEFFCNRPTVVAIIDFGTEISGIGDQQSESASTGVVSPESVKGSTENTVVKGLLGQGKSRTVFHLRMGMDSVRIYLNFENGKQLAMLDQEGFHMELRVFPASFGIYSTLGNLKIRDLTLAADHQWGWMCDIRDPGCDSLVKLDFQSFNIDEDDYRGYDYSLSGKLSSVRIVFLYRFIQEVIAYFTALSAPHTQHFTRVVDKVGGIEKLVPQSDIDGLPALKLNVYLETPIIIVPGDSASKDFMQLDLGYLNICNDFEWHGGSKDNDSAVHLDVLSAEISGINLVVGIGGVEGKSMIQDAQGLHLKVCRPLRDVFKRAPEVQVDVQGRLGFPQAWIRGVSALYRSASSSVTIGGQVGRRFQLSRSVRQGCPLAPYLFLFVAEAMSDFIRVHQPALRGLLMPVSDELELIDQEYADDALLFLHYTPDVLDIIRYALEMFCVASGARINWDKSYGILAGSHDVPTWGLTDFTWLRPVETCRYLGFQVGLDVSPEQQFSPVMQSMRRKLCYWSTRHLSMAGRALVANFLLQPGRALYVAIDIDGALVGFLTVYAPNSPRDRARFWSQLTDALPIVQMLKGILSDKEYLVISGCAASNFAEVPDLPPDFRNPATAVEEEALNTSETAGYSRVESDDNKSLRQSKTWTTVRVNVEVQSAELELHNGLEREFPLGRIEIQGLWLNYRSTSLQEITVLLTLPRFCILDLRPSTKPEMRLMLGSMADTEGSTLSNVPQDTVMSPRPPMLVMDAKLKQDSQAFIVRIQRPRLLVVLDFLLSVGEFFVPSLAAVTSKEENMDSCNDPLTSQEHLRLVTAYFKQEMELMTLSSNRRLIVDYAGIDVFTYDGCGNTLALDISEKNVSLPSVGEPLIVIGAGKKLIFKNITIKNGLRLKDCVQLHSHSSYSVFRDDGVFLDGATTNVYTNLPSQDSDLQLGKMIKPANSSASTSLSQDPMNFILELQVLKKKNP
ncbi:hypothetical protein L7F22_047439 [Adiantum nelumboides]|nr:hypothetical protein [Adiantum nelumboides]